MSDSGESAIVDNRGRGLLAAALTALKADEPGRYEDVLGYVLEGNPPDLLLRLDPLPKLTDTLLGNFCRWKWWEDDVQALVSAAVPGWDFYEGQAAWKKLLTKYDVLSHEQWVRLGELMLLSADLPADPGQGVHELPGWAWALWEHANAPLSATFLESLLETGGVAAADVPWVIIHAYIEGDSDSNIRPLAGIGDYAQRHLDQVRRAVSAGSLEGRLNALSLMKTTPALVAALPDAMATLAGASSKKVRDKAFGVLTGAAEAVAVPILEQALGQANSAALPGVIDQLSRTESGQRVLRQRAKQGAGKIAELARTALQRVGIADKTEDELVVPPCQPVVDVPLGDEFVAQLRAGVEREAKRMIERIARQRGESNDDTKLWLRESIKQGGLLNVGPEELEEVRAYLSGQGPRTMVVDQLDDIIDGIKLDLLPAMRQGFGQSGDGGKPSLSWSPLQNRGLLDVDMRVLIAAGEAIGYHGIYDAVEELGFGY